MDSTTPTIWEKKSNLLYTIMSIISILFAVGMIIYRFVTLNSIDKRSETLSSITNYSFSTLVSNDMLKNEYPLRRSLSDPLAHLTWLKEEIKSAREQREKLSLPCKNFLHFFYTPSLNIWKNVFDGEIDTSLVGEKYLEKNPYSDIELIQKWTNFFKDMWSDQYNTITDISLGSLQAEEWWFFALPITVQFETPDRRSFLLLVNKLSMTSYSDNVSLINEYMFYLRESIKKNKKEDIDKLLESGELPALVKTPDEVIGYTLYQRINNKVPTTLIDTDIINDAISRSAGCVDQDAQQCLYVFRDKFRAVPYLAYSISRNNINSKEWLRQFFLNLAPIISLESFSFDQKSQKWKKTRDTWYKWSISIKVYGKDLGVNEVDEIASKLWSLCFENKEKISPSYGITVVNRLIGQLWQQDIINAKRSNQLNQMLNYITKIQWEYEGLTNYRKVIRLFEVYRTLQESNACDLITSGKEDTTDPLSTLESWPISLPVKEDIVSTLTWETTTGTIQNTTGTKQDIVEEIVVSDFLETNTGEIMRASDLNETLLPPSSGQQQ